MPTEAEIAESLLELRGRIEALTDLAGLLIAAQDKAPVILESMTRRAANWEAQPGAGASRKLAVSYVDTVRQIREHVVRLAQLHHLDTQTPTDRPPQ